ncbi:MAG TPA: glutathione S-transferase N-terminal domain-containing protein [Solirubrobacteraceae bacterium]|nr:glutathione S-transferase N-terminal domain-containing protein [Solirubrobacteraceae bacterium]
MSHANGGPKIKLYVLPGSHPCAAVEVALERKGLSFARVNLLPMVQVGLGPILYGGSTVPGMRLDGERLVGSRTIMRRLDELAPDPPLLPADPAARARVLEAERWGDDVFQSVPRRILDAGFLIDPSLMESYAGDAKLPLPRAMLRPALPLTAKLMAKRNHAQEGPVRADLAALTTQLGQIDGWIAEGLIGGEQPNAADLQIGSTIRLLHTIGDIRPLIDPHPAAALTRYFPPMAGEIPTGTLPAAWLAGSASGS